MFRKIAAGALVVVAILAASTGAAWLSPISRIDLGIGTEPDRCRAPTIPSFWTLLDGYPDYDNELVANYFGLYAAYASNVYTPTPDESFDLDQAVFAWAQVGDVIERAGGFQAQVFSRETPDRVFVMTVFRGTDGIAAIDDLISNASWFTQMLNPWDQYRTARNVFAEIRAKSIASAKGKPISYLTVGHSLGGGLARHVAAAFPCVAAITFNSSFVTDEFRLPNPYKPQIVDVFEENDPLSRAALFTKPAQFFKNDKTHQWYRVRNIPPMDGQHGIFRAAAGMARIPVHCLVTKSDCQVNNVSWLAPGDWQLFYPKGLSEVQKLLCIGAPPTVRNERELCVGTHKYDGDP